MKERARAKERAAVIYWWRRIRRSGYESDLRRRPLLRLGGTGTSHRGLLPLYQTLGRRIGDYRNGRDHHDDRDDDRNDDVIDISDAGGVTSSTIGAAVLVNDVNLARRTGLKDMRAKFTSRHGGLSVTAMTYAI